MTFYFYYSLQVFASHASEHCVFDADKYNNGLHDVHTLIESHVRQPVILALQD